MATLSTADKSLWICSCARDALYLYDLMVDPAFRRSGLAQLLMTEARRLNCAGRKPAMIYGYVVSDNVASRQLLERLGYQVMPRLLRLHVALPHRIGREPPSDFCLTEPIEAGAAQSIELLLRSRYEGVDRLVGQEALAQLSWRGTRAWGILRRLESEVIDSVPWYFRVASLFSSAVLRPGQTVRAWSLHYLAADGPQTRQALEALIRSVAWLAAREKCDALLLPLFADDPTRPLIRRLTLDAWGLAAPSGRLYVGGDEASALLAARRPLLLSGSDA